MTYFKLFKDYVREELNWKDNEKVGVEVETRDTSKLEDSTKKLKAVPASLKKSAVPNKEGKKFSPDSNAYPYTK